MKKDSGRSRLIRLSARLSAIVSLVDGETKYPGDILCDVGTDHAHVPIRLLQEGRISSAVAMDIIPGPLEKARENLELYGVDPGLVRLRLSDGLEAYQAGEADTLVIAGMGGRIMGRILLQEPEKSCSFKEMVLQPQADPDYVRRALRRLGLMIDREKIVLEDGKFYQVIHAVPVNQMGKQSDQGEEQEKDLIGTEQRTEDLFGPVLLREKDKTLCSYLMWQKGVCERILLSMENSQHKDSAELSSRKKAVLRQLHLIETALIRLI